MSGQLQGQGLTFRLEAQSRTLIADLQPAPEAAPIDEVWLKARLAESGWAGLRISPEAVSALLEHYQQSRALAGLQLGECVDASLKITISPDRMQVLLDSEAAQGGEPISREQILDELKAQSVSYGIQSEAIDQAVAAGEAHGLCIAQGLAPVAGADGYLECLQPIVRSRVPTVDEFDHTDFRDLGEILTVNAGDRLMLRHPPTAGIAGCTVLGASLPATAGKDVSYAAALPGTSPAPDNPDLLLAAINGQPVLTEGGMIVEPVFAIESVNAASGNVRFNGSVKIRGDVQAGMTIQATGDIEVGGVVEAASLDAGGSIVIKGGAMGGLGHQEGSQRLLRCGGSFSAAYAQQARVEAGDSIFIDDSAMQCELCAVNNIHVGNSRRGQIIGGRAQATLSISARVIGSPNRVATLIEIGVNPVLHKQHQQIVKDREARENQLMEVSKLIDFARKHPGKVPAEMFDKAHRTAAALSSEIAEIRTEQQVLERKIERSKLSRVIAEQAIHEGVEVLLCGHHFRVFGEHGAGTISIGDQGLGFLSEEEIARIGAHKA
ncbi:DUF342 domain-containing protein [Niveibacterium terrae]|uniref:DUF342 domain-containing protein n=1 Tax=Niveibacterium terrae TaxID=3373598 RepID=UPI003A944B41